MIDIAVRDLVKEYEVGQPVLNGLTFQVDTGERVGILGRNGAGKTTLFRILTGHLPDPRLPRRVHRGGRAAHGL